MSNNKTQQLNVVDDAVIARQLQDMYDRENQELEAQRQISSHDTRYSRDIRQNITSDHPRKLNDALVAKYLQEMYDRDARVNQIDEDIYNFPSEGTVPRVNYQSKRVIEPNQGYCADTPTVLDIAVTSIVDAFSNLSEAITDTITHVASANTPTRQSNVSSVRAIHSFSDSSSNVNRNAIPARGLVPDEVEDWTEIDSRSHPNDHDENYASL